jgi:CRISPR-associated protein Cmr6
MPIAAVPDYLQKNDPEFYLSAPPGHRFLLYFPMWGADGETQRVDWRTKDKVKKFKRIKGELTFDGWTDIENGQFACTIAACKTPTYIEETPRAKKPKTDSGLKPWKPLMEALLIRQRQVFDTASTASLRLEALAAAPFTTGLGNEHPLENGFAFLNPYGLPYLPGSGIKGVLRQAARELASVDWANGSGWSEEKTIPLMQGEGARRKPVLDSHKQPVMLSMLDVLFGRETAGGDSDHVRGALSFWDVIPQIAGDSLTVEIMTPHQSHYYQQDAYAGSMTPHESGKPNPISFLTVPPGSGFVFHVQCDLAHLARIGRAMPDMAATGRPISAAPDLVQNDHWKALLEAAFTHAFKWLGFGAKTAAGYGAMHDDPAAKERKAQQEQAAADSLRQEQATRERTAALEQMPPAERAMREFIDARSDKNQTELSALLGGLKKGEWNGELKIEIARQAEQLMRTAKKWKEKSEKKNPGKDNDYQDTLKVMAWLQGK